MIPTRQHTPSVDLPGGMLTLRILSGLEAGILGGAILLLWVCLGCWVQDQSFWTIPNLLAATFHGPRMLRPDFTSATCSGIALHFLVAGFVGALFGSFRLPNWHSTTTAFLGLLYGLLLYSLGTAWFWRKFNGMMALYSTQTFVLVGYVLFGLSMGFIPPIARSLERHFLVH